MSSIHRTFMHTFLDWLLSSGSEVGDRILSGTQTALSQQKVKSVKVFNKYLISRP